MNIPDEISKNGYAIIDLLKKDEFEKLTDIIYDEFSKALFACNIENPIKVKDHLKIYHEFPIDINHGEFWTKKKRIINAQNLNQILKMDFINNLKKIFGDFKITNEEEIQSEEIYWRLVRPKTESDIGPIHADKWFWDGMQKYKFTKKNLKYERVKLWIPLYTELGISGLKIAPKSHMQEFKHEIKYIDGRIKIKEHIDKDKLDFLVLKLKVGEAVAFHDNLLHGGSFGENETRLSLEFTILKKGI